MSGFVARVEDAESPVGDAGTLVVAVVELVVLVVAGRLWCLPPRSLLILSLWNYHFDKLISGLPDQLSRFALSLVPSIDL